MGDLKFSLFLWNHSDWLFDKMLMAGGFIFVSAILLTLIVVFIDESTLMGRKFAAKHLFYQLFSFLSLTFRKKNIEMNKDILTKKKMLELEENKEYFLKSFIHNNFSQIKKTITYTQDNVVHNKKMNMKN